MSNTFTGKVDVVIEGVKTNTLEMNAEIDPIIDKFASQGLTVFMIQVKHDGIDSKVDEYLLAGFTNHFRFSFVHSPPNGSSLWLRLVEPALPTGP